MTSGRAGSARVLGTVALCATFVTLAAHLLVLWKSGQDPIATPISQLSRGDFGTVRPLVLGAPGANDPLSLVASAVGVAMGALHPGLRQAARWLAVANALCLAVWLLLIPLILLVDASWLGGYERLVGSTYLVWVGVLALGLRRARST